LDYLRIPVRRNFSPLARSRERSRKRGCKGERTENGAGARVLLRARRYFSHFDPEKLDPESLREPRGDFFRGRDIIQLRNLGGREKEREKERDALLRLDDIIVDSEDINTVSERFISKSEQT